MAEITVLDELEKADELRQRGIISQQEFDAFKAKLLGSSAPASFSAAVEAAPPPVAPLPPPPVPGPTGAPPQPAPLPPPMAPPPPPTPDFVQYGPATPKTSGLAIASFVLSLLWIAGVGSLLAIILALKARQSIKRSQGRESGDGLAIAGLVIGILGVLSSVVFIGAVATIDHAVHNLITTQGVTAGQPLNVSGALGTAGLSTVTAYSVVYPVDDSNGQPDPAAGKEYAAADIQVCAGPSGYQHGPTVLAFSLLLQGGQSAYIAPTAFPKQPDLASFPSIGANQCVRGFLTFEIVRGATPTMVQSWPDPLHKYQWTLPTG